MTCPIVELTGDEMAKVVWDQLKQVVLAPYVDLKLVSFDPSMANRDAPDHPVTHDAARAIMEHNGRSTTTGPSGGLLAPASAMPWTIGCGRA